MVVGWVHVPYKSSFNCQKLLLSSPWQSMQTPPLPGPRQHSNLRDLENPAPRDFKFSTIRGSECHQLYSRLIFEIPQRLEHQRNAAQQAQVHLRLSWGSVHGSYCSNIELGGLCWIFKQSMGASNRVGIGLFYRPARLHRLVELIPWNRFLGSLKV